MSGYCIKNQLENRSFKRNKEVKTRSVPARADSFDTTEHFVCTCCEFWLFYLLFIRFNFEFFNFKQWQGL